MFETPDLIFAFPFLPEGHGGAWVGVAVVGKIDVEVGVRDEDAEGKDP